MTTRECEWLGGTGVPSRYLLHRIFSDRGEGGGLDCLFQASPDPTEQTLAWVFACVPQVWERRVNVRE